MKRFNIVVPKSDGGVEFYKMKEWLRQHPEQVPPGLDPTSSTSHQLRSGLLKSGWTAPETSSEVRLIPPGGSVSDTLVEEVLGSEANSNEEETEEASFGLEFQLRDFIAQNIGAIDFAGKRLRLYVDPTGRDGIEFPTSVGLIDILAVDDAGNFFVFELKRGRTPHYTMGQLTGYMGWVQQTIGREKSVNGIVVAKEISENLQYAVSVVPNVMLFEYEVAFHLKPVHKLK